MTLQPFAITPVMGLLAATPKAGVPLVNGTPALLSWTAPSDGNNHRVALLTGKTVSSTETGGAVVLNASYPSGSGALPIFPGGAAAGISGAASFPMIVVAPGSTVSLAQSSALTGGASTVWAELWGS